MSSRGGLAIVSLRSVKRFWCTPNWQYIGKPKSISEGVWRIYNETPIRQNRGFPHYGDSLESIVKGFSKFDGITVVSYPESRSCSNCCFCCVEVHRGKGLYVFKPFGNKA